MCVKKICFLHVKMCYNFFHKVFAVHMETKLNQYVYKSKCHDFMIKKIRNHAQCKYAIWIYQLWSHYFLQEQLFIYTKH